MCQRVSFVFGCNLSNQDLEESYFGNNFEDEDYDNFTSFSEDANANGFTIINYDEVAEEYKKNKEKKD